MKVVLCLAAVRGIFGRINQTTMRRSFLLLFLLPNLLAAQTEFAKVWETKLSFDPRWTACTQDLDYVLAVVLTDFQMLDGETGKTLWNYNFKEKHGVSKFERYSTHPENETVKSPSKRKARCTGRDLFPGLSHRLCSRRGAIVRTGEAEDHAHSQEHALPRREPK